MTWNPSKAYTVRQLITELSKLDPYARVFVEGYESGIQDLQKVDEVLVKLDANDDEYGGPHDYYDEYDDGDAPHVRGYLLR